MLTAEIDALRVDVLHALPGIRFRDEDGVVVRGRDAGVVVEDVDASVAGSSLLVHLADALWLGDVDRDREGVARVGSRLRCCLGVDVCDADPSTLFAEEQGGFAAHSSSGAGDDRDLAVEASHHSVLTKTFFTSE